MSLTHTRPLPLFDAPLARTTDPATSHEAAAGVDQTAREVFFATLEKSREPMTASEVALEAVGTEFNGSWEKAFHRRETVRKRANELVALGRIETCGERPCTVTGKRATVYRVKQ